MQVVSHNELPIHTVPRIQTRVIVNSDSGAKQTAVWEQWIRDGGHIPLHYHDVEEVLVFLNGSVELTVNDETRVIQAPASAIIPAGDIHGVRMATDDEVHLIAFFPTASPTILSPDGEQRPMPWMDMEA